MSILNLTQHPATIEQVAAGVVDLSPAQRVILGEWLTFEFLPTAQEITSRAKLIAQACAGDSKSIIIDGGYTYAMIGGAPFLMSALENALIELDITPMYAFSVRESAEQVIEGKVVKTNVFNHLGFVQI